jgi:hypothetical protein
MKSFPFSAFAFAVLVIGGLAPAAARDMAKEVVVAAAPQAPEQKDDGEEAKLTPEERMNSRFPQAIRVGDLVGLPVLDGLDNTLGFIQQVVRTPEGKIQLVVPYRRSLGWLPSGVGRRSVAVPIEAVAILGRQVAALEMEPEDFDKAPTFAATSATALSLNDQVRIAITRR